MKKRNFLVLRSELPALRAFIREYKAMGKNARLSAILGFAKMYGKDLMNTHVTVGGA